MAPSAESRVWLITGGSSGIGAALAAACVAAGDQVVVTSRDPGDLARLWATAPDRVLPLRLDLTRPGEVAGVVDAVTERFGRIDVLVNNAGRGANGAVEEVGLDVARELMEILYFGPLALVQAVLPQMRARGAGTILQISSVADQISIPGLGHYSAPKFALRGVSEALAVEVAPLGVRVVVAELGGFRTGFMGERLHRSDAIDDAYAATAGPIRAAMDNTDGMALGDPNRAALALRRLVDGPTPPVRVPVGDDAVAMLRAQHAGLLEEFETAAGLAVDTGFRDEDADEAAYAERLAQIGFLPDPEPVAV